MPDAALDILNARWVGPDLLSAGQPTEAQFQMLADAGIKTVVNLALPTSPGALPDEASVARRVGLEPISIPIRFEAPRTEDWVLFCQQMDQRRGQKICVHCALNYRASAFVALYRVHRLGCPPAVAIAEMRTVWEPDEVWARFLSEQGLPIPPIES